MKCFRFLFYHLLCLSAFPYSQEFTCASLCDAGEGWNSMLLLSNISAQSVLISWTEDTATTLYVVQVRERNESIFNTSMPIADVSFPLMGLTPLTEYEVQVCRANESTSDSDNCGNCLKCFTTVRANAPMQVQNVRVYVYFPVRGGSDVTALVVWDGLSAMEAGGVVDNYTIRVFNASSGEEVTGLSQNSDARTQYVIESRSDGTSTLNTTNLLQYPLVMDNSYRVEVFASNSAGDGDPSQSIIFSTDAASPPEQVFGVSMSGGEVIGNGTSLRLDVSPPLTVNTINRTVYWYRGDLAEPVLMQQPLDGGEPELLGQPPAGVIVLAMAYDWVGETVYFITRRDVSGGILGLWRVVVVNPSGLELVFEDGNTSLSVEDLIQLAVDPFRGFVYWTLQSDAAIALQQLNLRDPTSSETLTATLQRRRRKRQNQNSFFLTSALTFDPVTGRLWVCHIGTGNLLSCDPASPSVDCIEEVIASNLRDGGEPVRMDLAGLPAASIALDESRIYWTGIGTARIFFVSRTATTNLMMIGADVCTVTTLSPGQQPLPSIGCLSPAPVAVRPNIRLVNATNLTLTVTWTTPTLPPNCSDEVFSVAPFKYDLLPENRTGDTVLGYPQSTFDSTYVLTGLQPNTEYCVKLRAENQYSVRPFFGDDGFGTSVIHRTLDVLTCGTTGPPTIFNCTASNSPVVIQCQYDSGLFFDCTNDFPLEVDPTLPPGAHTLTVVYTDIFNQTSEQTISFNVAVDLICSFVDEQASSTSVLNVDCFTNIPYTSVSCSFDSGSPENCTFRGPTNATYFGYTVNQSRFFEGSHEVTTNVTDADGNSDQETIPFTIPPVALKSDSGLPQAAVIGIAVGGSAALVVLLACLFLCVWCVYGKHKKYEPQFSNMYGPDRELNNLRKKHRQAYNPNYMWSRDDYVCTDKDLELLHKFPRENLKLETLIGSGEFGEVIQGTATDILGPDTGPTPVAVKTLRTGATVDEQKKFLSEASLMSNFNHPNIVKVLGVCVDNDPVYIIMELMPAGDLLCFLREARREYGPALLTLTEQMQIVLDVSQGCRYLEQQHFIHRDIAARNCLVSSKGADRVIKIGDFGLAKDLYNTDYYQVEGQRRLPVRWMAPEALLQGKFTIESDIWSFGVVLWEIMTLGNQPYPGRTNQEVLQFVTGGGRLERPAKCPQKIYHLMQKCWKKYPSKRPHFQQIVTIIANFLDHLNKHEGIYFDSDSESGSDTMHRKGSTTGSTRGRSRTPSIQTGVISRARSGSMKLRNSLRRAQSLKRREELTANLISSDNPIAHSL